MSKQSKAKEAQKYTKVLKTCSNCMNFNSEKEVASWNKKLIIERNLRCSIGGFKVNKIATCSLHKPQGK